MGDIMRKFILLCGMIVSNLSFGADWVYIGSSKSGDKFYIDFDFYQYDKKTNSTLVWTKTNERLNQNYYTRQKNLTKYYCKDKSFITSNLVTYYPDGNVKSSVSGYALNFDKTSIIVPDTLNENIWNIACGTPAQGLDFKYPDIEDFDDYAEYNRARYAYIRLKSPHDSQSIFRLVSNVKIENYNNYPEYERDIKNELDKIRMKNIQNFK